MKSSAAEDEFRHWYGTLLHAWGPQHWWPARSRFEVIAGAYLTQNTSWTNVEKALANLRRDRALSPARIAALPLAELEQLLRPAGYFRQKAARLKGLVAFLNQRYGGSLHRMFAQPTPKLRAELLELNGVGRETADAILLYAGQHPVFVVDAYTRRTLARHRLIAPAAPYEEIRAMAERSLGKLKPQEVMALGSALAHKPTRMSRAARPAAAQVYNEMHGLLVVTGKLHCHKRAPKCEGCPLEPLLPPEGPRLDVAL